MRKFLVTFSGDPDLDAAGLYDLLHKPTAEGDFDDDAGTLTVEDVTTEEDMLSSEDASTASSGFVRGEDGLWIAVTGNPLDGLTFHGPFTSPDESVRFSEDWLTEMDWWTAFLVDPVNEGDAS